MSETDVLAEPAEPVGEAAPGAVNAQRRLAFGIASVVLGVIMVLAFGFGSAAGLDSVFVMNRGETPALPDITVPSRVTSLLLGGVVVGLGVAQLSGMVRRRTYLVFSLALVLFVLALLAWAARGDDINMLGLLQGTLTNAVPLAFGAMGGLLCERSGVINIGIEGMLLSAAFAGAITASASGSIWVGMLSGAAIGALLGALLAVLSIRYRVDQIIGGTVIYTLALGLTSFLAARLFTEYRDLNQPGTFTRMGVPLLQDVPFVGPLLFNNTFYVYLMFALVFALTWALYRTRWGLRVRSVGEHPGAADTVGVNVQLTRYRSVIMGGAVAGLGGTWFTLDRTGGFEENMTAGLGFIALAALIFGRWHPIGALVAALVFGFAQELQGRLALLETPIPSEFLLAVPYVVTIVVVAGLIGRARPPAANGQVYERY